MFGHGGISRALISLVVLAVAACTETPTGADVDIAGVTVTATPNPAEVVVTVQASAVVAPAGVSQSVTWSSSDTDIATVDATGLVTLRLRGTVTITATSTVDATKSGSVTLTIVCPAPRLVTANVSDDTTWENWVPDPSCYDYIVQADIHMNDDVLTIEPGTVVGFDGGIGMRIRTGATLVAAGTADDPILLTGTTKERGFWKGLALEFTNHGNNVLTYVTVEYTGGANISNTEDASLIFAGNAVARVENATFSQSEGYGVSLNHDSRITGAGGNTFTGNALGAAWAYGTAVPYLNSAVLTGNDVDVVVVRPNTITEAVSWPAAVYRILRVAPQAFTVQGGELTLVPGTQLRFEGDQSMIVMQGGLSAVGTAQAPIVLTGTQAIRGHWGGLGFIGTERAMNRLEHVIVEYGGGRQIGTAVQRANVVVTRGAAGERSRVTIQNTTLRRSAEFGLWARLDSELTEFEDNTLTENLFGPAYVHAPVVDYLLASNSYGGNDNNEILVETGTGMAITEAATWRDLGVPYHLRYANGPETEVNAKLTIEPGVEMLMAPGLGISMRNGGSMSAIGTMDNRITMKAKGEPWKGLDFLESAGNFDYIDIEDGGSSQWALVQAAGVVTIRAPNTASVVFFTGEVTITGGAYGIVFSYGESIAVGCPARIYIPPPDQVADHCRPPA